MKNTSRIQRVTAVLFIGYIFYEIGIWIWAKKLPPNDPIIRVDLILIYPILLLLIFISVYQYFKSKPTKSK